MTSESEYQYHRSFLLLYLCKKIYDEDERYQNYPGGPPGRQQKIDSDPVFKYHVQSGPRYPQRAPGLPIDSIYNALQGGIDGSFNPIVIIPKRGQQFTTVATPWERHNSSLCDNSLPFRPVLNSEMLVTGHFANVSAANLIHPDGISFPKVTDYIEHGVELFLWNYSVFNPDSSQFSSFPAPPGWRSFADRSIKDSGMRETYNGGIDVMVLPNGKVVSATGRLFTSNNGQAIQTVSPLDFWSPGARFVTGAIRALTNKAEGMIIKAGFKFFSGPTREVAEAAVARLAAAEARGAVAVEATAGRALIAADVKHQGRRTIIMGEDMARIEATLFPEKIEKGLYDVAIHGDSKGFAIVVGKTATGKPIYKPVSVREVADLIRPRLALDDEIRLLSCEVGVTGGPAQQLANLLERPVWAANTPVPFKTGVTKLTPKGPDIVQPSKAFIPDYGGKFSRLSPQPRGAVTPSGANGTIRENTVHGTIGGR